ncbi:hypothetical protein [Azospirillum palustre]
MSNDERSVPWRSFFLFENTHKDGLSDAATVRPEYQVTGK